METCPLPLNPALILTKRWAATYAVISYDIIITGIDRPTAYNVITTTTTTTIYIRRRVQRFFGGARTAAAAADTPSGPGGHAPRPIAAPGHSLPPSNPSPIDPWAAASARAPPCTRGRQPAVDARSRVGRECLCVYECVRVSECVRKKCGPG